MVANDYCARLIDRPLSQIIGPFRVRDVRQRLRPALRGKRQSGHQAKPGGRAGRKRSRCRRRAYLSVGQVSPVRQGRQAVCLLRHFPPTSPERKQAQRQLEEYRDQLEVAVASRTAELEIANKNCRHSVIRFRTICARRCVPSMASVPCWLKITPTGWIRPADYLLRVHRAAGRMRAS